MDRVGDDVVAEIIGFPVGDAGLDPAASHPDGEAARMVVTPIVFAGKAALTVDGAAELSPPDHQGVLEEPPLFEILDESMAGLVHIAALQGEVAGQVSVLIPAAVENLGEADPPFRETAREDAVVGERSRLAGVGTVHLEDAFRLVLQIHQVRHAGLHAERHLILGNAGLDLRIADLFVQLPVHFAQAIEHDSPQRRVDPCGIGQIEHRIPLGPQGHSLVF